jgi:hypothetical protein
MMIVSKLEQLDVLENYWNIDMLDPNPGMS